MTPDAEQVYEALKTLPDSAQAIADLLHEQEITGRIYSARSCPIARWIFSATGKKVTVTGSYFRVLGEPDLNETMPPAVTTFIKAFDHGIFPELEDGNGP